MGRKRIRFSDQIRQAVDTCGKSRYEISKDTGIDQATLCRFMGHNGGLSIPVLDKLADYLDLNITTGSKAKGK
jgi:hypothetical protein